MEGEEGDFLGGGDSKVAPPSSLFPPTASSFFQSPGSSTSPFLPPSGTSPSSGMPPSPMFSSPQSVPLNPPSPATSSLPSLPPAPSLTPSTPTTRPFTRTAPLCATSLHCPAPIFDEETSVRLSAAISPLQADHNGNGPHGADREDRTSPAATNRLNDANWDPKHSITNAPSFIIKHVSIIIIPH